MHLNLVLCLSVCGLCSAFFLLHDKKKPLIFCFKICPLYCPERASKRHDNDGSPLIYLDHNPYNADGSGEYVYRGPGWKSKSTPKSTTNAPTTKKKQVYRHNNPYFIEEGSGEYEYHPRPRDHGHWKPKPTPKPTEAPTTSTDSPIYLDHNPHITDDAPDYEYYYSPHYHSKPKPTTKTTTTKAATTTERPFYLDHNPYIIEDWPEYEYHSAPRYYEAWSPTPHTTTTAAPTTTTEPTYICGLCKEKCDHNS